MRRQRIICPCGANVTGNTYKRHISSKYCTVSDKETVLTVLKLKTKHTRAWLKAEGADAVNSINWYMSVIEGHSSLDEWSFVSPRPSGQVTPAQCKRMSTDRIGSRNPSVKSKKFDFSKQDVLDFIAILMEEFIANSSLCFGDLKKITDNKFPNFMYLFVDEKLTFRKLLLRYSSITEYELNQLIPTRRGLRISIGQLASPTCRQKAAQTASKLFSKWRISFPHRVLYAMVKSIDPAAKMEFPIESKAYDIYSPLINVVIEMHGDFWHSISPKTGSMLPLIEKNIKNDEYKKSLAIINNFGYFVFWQSGWPDWPQKLRSLYGTDSINIQEAENQVNQELGTSRSLRH